MAAEIRFTKDLFLWSMSVIYLFAFASLFVQIPGLYGEKGILPSRLVVQTEAESFYDLFTNRPTLLRLLPKIGLDVQAGMDFLGLGGIIVSFVAMVSRDCRNTVVFGVLWAFYLSLFQVGQTFTLFKWDLLLLEAGFLAVIVAPLNLFGFYDAIEHHAHDSITMWPVKWLLFRLTFASGVVKLLSYNATWWSLTAMKYHYETQLLPTSMAWLLHQFPDWWHQLTSAAILVIEILVSLLFLSPSKKQQHFALYCQFAHMLLLILSGNFSFYPLLVLTLCLSLVDDDFIEAWIRRQPKAEKDHPRDGRHSSSAWFVVMETVFLVVTYGGLLLLVFCSFFLNFKSTPLSLEPELAFSPEDFDCFVSYALPLTLAVGVISLLWQITEALVKVFSKKRHFTEGRVNAAIGCLFFGAIAFMIFSVSLVPHSAIHKETESHLPPKLKDVYAWTLQNYRLVNPYNLFLNTSEEAEGRVEVVIEGSNHVRGGWKEYSFRYKPDDVAKKLPIIAPHQPRLDTQMWFAARGRCDQNPWFINFVFRLLKNQREVLELLDINPFPDKAPKYIRATLYRYRFATRDTKTERFAASDWWMREPIRQYLTPVNLEEPSFVDYLMDAGIYTEGEELSVAEKDHNLLYWALEAIRNLLGQGSGTVVCVILLISGFALTLVDPNIRLVTEEEHLANGVTSHDLCVK